MTARLPSTTARAARLAGCGLALFFMCGQGEAGTDVCGQRLGPGGTAAAYPWIGAPAHPLVGTLYATADKRTLDPARATPSAVWTEFAGKAGPAAILILGEAHDNPDHHALRGALLDCGQPAGAIVMEQFRADQQEGLDGFARFARQARRPATIEDLKRLGGWQGSGWETYPYDPLLGTLVRLGLPIIAGDPARETIRKAAREGQGALAAGERARLGLDVPLGPALDAASLSEIEAAHCGMMPKPALGGMAFAQRYRDAHLADATLKAAESHGASVLLTGNNHARSDRGVPWYIRQRAPGQSVVAVVLAEVENGQADPEAYLPRDPDGKPAANYVLFTPSTVRADPCAAFGKEEKPGP